MATGSLNKYRSDLFFRTEVRIISLQILFVVLILGFFSIAVYFIGQHVSREIATIVDSVLGADAPPELIPKLVEGTISIRWMNFILYVLLVVPITVIFSYLIAYLTLSPVRGALDQQKKFIGNIAHELRTPLSVLKTNSEIALLHQEMPQEMREQIISNNEELDRISGVINNLLSISAFMSPQHVRFSAVNLPLVAYDVVQKYQELALKHDIRIMIREGSYGFVWGNTSALQQVIGNLIDNAIKYTPKNGTISITAWEAPRNHVELVVQDTGVGIARKDLQHVFEPFYRADLSRTHAMGGSGLGLAIVSEIVKMHQGKISVQSAVGVGTRVSILLPGIPLGGERRATDIHDMGEIEVDFSRGT